MFTLRLSVSRNVTKWLRRLICLPQKKSRRSLFHAHRILQSQREKKKEDKIKILITLRSLMDDDIRASWNRKCHLWHEYNGHVFFVFFLTKPLWVVSCFELVTLSITRSRLHHHPQLNKSSTYSLS